MLRLRPSQVALIRCPGLWRTAIDPLRSRIACFVGQGGGDAPSGAAGETPTLTQSPGCTRPWTFDGQRKALRLHRLIEQVGGGAPALAGKRTDLPRIVGVYRLSRDCRQELRGRRGDRARASKPVDQRSKGAFCPAPRRVKVPNSNKQPTHSFTSASLRQIRRALAEPSARVPKRGRALRFACVRSCTPGKCPTTDSTWTPSCRRSATQGTRFDSSLRRPPHVKGTLKPRRGSGATSAACCGVVPVGRRTATGTNAQHGTTNTASVWVR